MSDDQGKGRLLRSLKRGRSTLLNGGEGDSSPASDEDGRVEREALDEATRDNSNSAKHGVGSTAGPLRELAQPSSRGIGVTASVFKGQSVDENAELLQLIDRVAKGDKKAFTALYLKVSGRVRAFVRCRTANHATADEVVQDTMFAVWEDAGRFAQRSKVLVWILGIARNKARETFRKTRGGAWAEEDIDDSAESLPDSSPTPDEALEFKTKTKATQEQVKACIQALPPKQQECVLLTFYSDLNSGEVGLILGIPAGTVRQRLHHAMQNIKSQLRDRNVEW